MNRPKLDVATLAIGLAAVGFAVVLLASPALQHSVIQPILAAVLIVAGTIGLVASRNRANTR